MTASELFNIAVAEFDYCLSSSPVSSRNAALDRLYLMTYSGKFPNGISPTMSDWRKLVLFITNDCDYGQLH